MSGNPEILIPIIEVACVGSMALGIVSLAIVRWGVKNFSEYVRGIRAEVGEEQP